MNILLKWPLLIGGIVGATFLAITFLPTDSQPVASVQSVVASQPVAADLPVRIRIPKIKVDAAIESVGLTADGAMEAPKDFTQAGWFNLGTIPGNIGSSVIAGHYGWKRGKPSVFDNLYKLRKGDKVYIEDGDGQITVFIVRGNRRYGAKADATGVFFSDDGKAHLNLITCEGTWNKADKTYSDRLVVFADQE